MDYFNNSYTITCLKCRISAYEIGLLIDRIEYGGNTVSSEPKLDLKLKIALSYLSTAFTVFSICFFAPMEIYLGNIIDFHFPLQNFWWILLLASLFVTLIIGSILWLLPKTLCLFTIGLVFSLGLCCYLQAIFFNSDLNIINGGKPQFSSEVINKNLLAWILIVVISLLVIIVFRLLHKSKLISQIIVMVSLSLILMQSVALITQLLSTDLETNTRTAYFTSEGEFELSSKNNVIIFILDACDDDLDYEPLLAENPEIMEPFKGFTYYPDAVSTYSRTYPSIPYLLTEQRCYFNKPYYEYIDSAYEKSTYLTTLKQTDADLRVFTDSQFIGKDANKYLSNIKQADKTIPLSRMKDFFDMMLKVSLYREAPYLTKDEYFYTSTDINDFFRVDDQAIQENEIDFYRYLTNQGLSINQSYNATLRFYHLYGPHPGSFYDENLEWKENANRIDSLKGDFKLLTEYITQLKELGIYGSSTIIITADHGRSSGAIRPDLSLPFHPRPIMLVKPAGASEENFSISNDQVSHENLFEFIQNALVGKSDNQFNYPVSTRYYYYSGTYYDGKGEMGLLEYSLTGDSRLYSSWQYTGNYWNIDYSELAVSKHRMKELTNEPAQETEK